MYHTFITADYVLIIVMILTMVYNFISVSRIYKKLPFLVAEKMRKSIPLLLFAYIIIVPIIEESLFRHTLATYAVDWYYHKVFNVVLFGSTHIFSIDPDIKNAKLSSLIAKLSMPMYLGFYLVYHTCFPISILIHGIFNSVVLLPVYTFIYFKHRNKRSPIDLLDPLDSFCDDNSKIVYVNTFNRKIRKSKSFELLLDKAISNKYISVDISNTPINVLESIKKYNEIENKRRKKYVPKE